MSRTTVVGLSGNFTRPSKTRSFVSLIAAQTAASIGAAVDSFDLVDLGASLGHAKRLDDLDSVARRRVDQLVSANVLVVGSPTYKGSYTGLFKHLFDLLDPTSLRGKPVILTATGGGDRHSLIVEHQLRPLFGFFEAFTLPTAIYAAERDFTDGQLVSEPIRARIAQAVAEAARAAGVSPKVSLAA